MRKITIDKYTQIPMVETKDGWKPLSAVLKSAMQNDGVMVYPLEVRAGISHPGLVRVLQGKNDSPKVMISALDELGYDVMLVKRKP